MATIVELPRLSDTMEEGVVARWLVQEGDKVKRGQVIAEIETDKATMEFESFDAGVVLALVASEGDALPIGAAIAVLGEAGEDPGPALSAHREAGGGGAPASGEASQGSSAGDPVEAEKSTSSGAPASRTESAAGRDAGQESGEGAAAGAVHVDPESRRVPASPVARRLAHEAGLELTDIEGSGPHGRVIKADVERARAASAEAPVAASRGQASSEADEHGRPYLSRENRRVRLSQMRKAIARNMSASKFAAPHFYLTIDLEMDAAVRARAEYNAALDEGKVSYNDMVIAAAARALKKHPRVNAAYTDEGIVEYGDVNVGVAVAIDDGLLVPVLRHAEQKTLAAVGREVRRLGELARDRQLRPEQMQGGTFTVSNLGMFGIEQFTAVINPGEGAIMAVGALREELVMREGAPAVVHRMRVTLSSDHRVIDGAVGAEFLRSFRAYLETPMRLFT